MEHKVSIPFELLNTSAQVNDLVGVLLQERRIAIDTESNSRHRYPERVCLIQVATSSNVYLIDTLSVNDMRPIGEVLSEPNIVKVIQGADYDLRCLDREWGFRVRNLFDTSVAARFVGMKQSGLAVLIDVFLGVQVEKDAQIQKSDWSQRPFNQKALDYAATDVWYLLGIQEALEKKLRTIKRFPWVLEECTRLEEIRYVAPDPETAYLSLKGTHNLDGQQRAILKRLFTFREVEARRRNRPPYYVLSHETLIYLACNPHLNLDQCSALMRTSHFNIAKRLRETLDMGLADQAIRIPIRQTVSAPTSIDIERLQMLKRWRSNLGVELSIDPALVWPRISLNRLAKAPSTFSAELQSAEVREWQREQFAMSLAAVLD
jgi:ribonuclease D